MKVITTTILVFLPLLYGCSPDIPTRNTPVQSAASLLYCLRFFPDTNLYIFNVNTGTIEDDSVLNRIPTLRQHHIVFFSSISHWGYFALRNSPDYLLSFRDLATLHQLSLPSNTLFFPVPVNSATALFLSMESEAAYILDYSEKILPQPQIVDTLQLPAPPLLWTATAGKVWIAFEDHTLQLYQIPGPPVLEKLVLDHKPAFLTSHPVSNTLWIGTIDNASRNFPIYTYENGSLQLYATVLLPEEISQILGAQITRNDFLYLFTLEGLYRIDLFQPSRIQRILQGQIRDFLIYSTGSFSLLIENSYYHFNSSGQITQRVPLPYDTYSFVE